jgi:hypothetical protein
VTYTEGQIKAAIDEWAEAQVDANIAEDIKYRKVHNEKARKIENGELEKPSAWWRANYYSEDPESFDREEIRHEIAEEFYSEVDETELPGLGKAKLVDSYGGEGKGEEYWRVFEIDGNLYKADHYYASYGESEPWQDACTWFPVTAKTKTVTVYEAS